MLRKRQVATLVSIAVVSFLVGTSVATDGGNPFDSIWNAFYGLESRVETLEEQSIPQGFVSSPAYDSGWTNLGVKVIADLEHGLNTTNIFVFIGHRNGTQEVTWHYRTPNMIRIRRVNAINLNWEIRVMIWRLPEPPT